MDPFRPKWIGSSRSAQNERSASGAGKHPRHFWRRKPWQTSFPENVHCVVWKQLEPPTLCTIDHHLRRQVALDHIWHISVPVFLAGNGKFSSPLNMGKNNHKWQWYHPVPNYWGCISGGESGANKYSGKMLTYWAWIDLFNSFLACLWLALLWGNTAGTSVTIECMLEKFRDVEILDNLDVGCRLKKKWTELPVWRTQRYIRGPKRHIEVGGQLQGGPSCHDRAWMINQGSVAWETTFPWGSLVAGVGRIICSVSIHSLSTEPYSAFIGGTLCLPVSLTILAGEITNSATPKLQHARITNSQCRAKGILTHRALARCEAV